MASWQPNIHTHDASKNTLEMMLAAENLSIIRPLCAEFSFRSHKQVSTKGDTARKKVVLKSFTSTLENRPRADKQ